MRKQKTNGQYDVAVFHDVSGDFQRLALSGSDYQ